MTALARTRAQAAWELRLLLRNGEQLLLTVIIPIGLFLGMALTDLMPAAYGADRVPRALATVLTVSVIAAAFTSLAIATAFERRSGALRFLGTTPLTRTELLVGKASATAAVTALSAALVGCCALIVGWRPEAVAAWTVPMLALGAAAFAAWGFALAGLLRAEAVLAVANGLFLVLILFGGVVIPAASLPGAMATIAPYLPSGALATALDEVLVSGVAPSMGAVLVLAGWLVAGGLLAARTFRWS